MQISNEVRKRRVRVGGAVRIVNDFARGTLPEEEGGWNHGRIAIFGSVAM